MNRRGFTLIEVIVSLFIVVVAVIGTASMMTLAFRQGRMAEDRNASAMLAEEGARQARAKLDSAVATQAWMDAMAGSPDQWETAVY